MLEFLYNHLLSVILGGVVLVPLVTVALSVRMDMKLIEKALVCVVSYDTVLQ